MSAPRISTLDTIRTLGGLSLLTTDHRFKDVRVWDFPTARWITIGEQVGHDTYETVDDDGFLAAPYVLDRDTILDLMERSSELAGHLVG